MNPATASSNKTVYPASDDFPGILYTHIETKKFIANPFIAEHGLCQVISGKLLLTEGSQTRVFSPGELLFFRKNQLTKCSVQPDGLFPFRAITVVFDQDSLNQCSRQFNLGYEYPYFDKSAVLPLDNSMLLDIYFQTLSPYFDKALPDNLAPIKKQEALRLLLQINPAFKNILFDLDQPGKLDLAEFMLQHFHFNADLKQFAWLTGRSIATFKRDFEKIFHTTPNKWLQERRLQEAHYLLKEKKKKPTEVVHEVGFETLPLFSQAFKQRYGVSPSRIGKKALR